MHFYTLFCTVVNSKQVGTGRIRLIINIRNRTVWALSYFHVTFNSLRKYFNSTFMPAARYTTADEMEKCGDGSAHGELCAERDNNNLKIIRGKIIIRNSKIISKEINKS
jgi:hypothetical protein